CEEAEIVQDPGAVPGLLRPAVVVNVAVRVGARTDFRFRPVALVDSAWPSGCVGRGRVLDRCLHECEHVLHTGSWRCYADHAGGSPQNGVSGAGWISVSVAAHSLSAPDCSILL